MLRLKDFAARVQGLVSRAPVNLPHYTPPVCPLCDDTGWRQVQCEAKGRIFPAVVPCECRVRAVVGPTLAPGEITAARIAALGKASK